MIAMGQTINVMTEFVTHTCPTAGCGIAFAVESGFNSRRQEDHRDFYCPNGHTLAFQGKTELQKAKDRTQQLERLLANRDEDLRSAKASLTATKGQLTKVRKRAANGVCPAGCHRAFANLTRHMANQHPDFVESVKA